MANDGDSGGRRRGSSLRGTPQDEAAREDHPGDRDPMDVNGTSRLEAETASASIARGVSLTKLKRAMNARLLLLFGLAAAPACGTDGTTGTHHETIATGGSSDANGNAGRGGETGLGGGAGTRPNAAGADDSGTSGSMGEAGALERGGTGTGGPSGRSGDAGTSGAGETGGSAGTVGGASAGRAGGNGGTGANGRAGGASSGSAGMDASGGNTGGGGLGGASNGGSSGAGASTGGAAAGTGGTSGSAGAAGGMGGAPIGGSGQIGGAGAGGTSSCTPGSYACANSTDWHRCGPDGTWGPTSSCVNQACVNGACAGVCAPGATSCYNGNKIVQTCDASGQWGSPYVTCAQPTPDCSAGACTCLESVCGGSCTNTQTDPNNCGACGHVCPCNGTCSNGACGPAAFGGLGGLLATNGSMFFGNTTTSAASPLADCPSSGCGSPTILASGASAKASEMVADSTNAYWVEPGSSSAYDIVWQCAVGGCSGTPTALGFNDSATGGGVGASGADAIAVDWANVYWADAQGVVKCAIGGCGNNPSPLSSPTATSLAIGGTNIFGTYFGNPVSNIAGFVWMCPTSGCGSGYTNLAASQRYPDHLILSGANLYWINEQNGGNGPFTVVTCAAAGCASSPTTVTSGTGCPSGLAADASNIYWNDGCSGNVMKAPITGGAAALVATGATGTGISVDSACVYYGGTTGLMMTAK